ncbi:MAG TPA: HAD family phosphatase [Polyangiaceae bacterium]|jgi:HAD superfamily hydrolase (TIGR01509 family)
MYATLFDFDGVLVDSEPVHLAAFNDVLGPRGITIDEHEYVSRYLSLDDAGVFRAVISRGGKTVREEEVRALVEAKNPRFMARFEDAFRIFPGARELLARRAERAPVGIVSGALEREVVFALEKMGARDSVAFVISAEKTPVSKPDPAPYLAGVAQLRKLGHAGGIVAVEDSIGGVKSAKGAGIRCVGVSHSYPGDQLGAAGADAVVADLAALSDALLEGA